MAEYVATRAQRDALGVGMHAYRRSITDAVGVLSRIFLFDIAASFTRAHVRCCVFLVAVP